MDLDDVIKLVFRIEDKFESVTKELRADIKRFYWALGGASITLILADLAQLIPNLLK